MTKDKFQLAIPLMRFLLPHILKYEAGKGAICCAFVGRDTL